MNLTPRSSRRRTSAARLEPLESRRLLSAAPAAPDLAASTDSGVSDTDNITLNNNAAAERELEFLVAGTVAGATVNVYADGSLIATATAPGASTTVRTTAGTALAEGKRQITARQTEPGGTESADSAALAVTIDSIATTLTPTPFLAAASDTGASASDNITTDTTPTFNVASRTTYYRLYVDGVRAGGLYDVTSTTVAAPLAPGVHSARASAVDAAGNESTQGTAVSFTIDTSAPTVALQSATGVTAPGANNYSFTVRYSDDLSFDVASIGAADVRVTTPSGAILTPTSSSVDLSTNGTPRVATYSISPPGGRWDSADSGTYTISSVAGEVRDVAGNLSGAAADLGTFAVNVPQLSIDLVDASDAGVSTTDNITNRNNADGASRLTFRVSNTFSGATVSIRSDGVQIGSATATSTSVSVTTTSPAKIADGSHAFVARVSGLADSAPLAVTIDATQPSGDFDEVTPDPRTTPVDVLTLRFTEPVYNLDLDDLSLRRNNTTVSNGFGLSLEPAGGDDDGRTYLVRDTANLTRPAGSYTAFAFSNGNPITDLAGNMLNGNAAESWTNNSTVEGVPPAVAGMFISGTNWAQPFKDFLAASGAGDATYGFAIRAPELFSTLPWTNLNRISIRFTEDVSVAADDLAVRGVTIPTYARAAIGGFSYDAATFTATWTLDTTGIPNDKILLDLDADPGTGVTDRAGNALDGDWPNANYPSGNGTPGPAFRQVLSILPGDVNRSAGSVTGSDVTLTRNAQNATPGGDGSLYTIFKDVNGSGSILGSDVTLVRNRQGLALPAGNPSIVVGDATAATTTMPPAKATPAKRLALLLPPRERKLLVDELS